MRHDPVPIHAAILSKYGSLTEPRFDFVHAAIEVNEYHELVEDLRSSFELNDDTDPNDDVSFGFLLRWKHGSAVLRLSMIGRYAALLRVNEDNRIHLVDPGAPMTPEERYIMDALRRFQIQLLDQATLNLRIPLKLSNTTPENCRLYQALFTDSDVLPWEG